MDRLTSLTVFSRVVETGGFSAAAHRLNMSVTAVSNHIQALEKHLCVRLLNRTTRRISLTEIGRAYHERINGVLTELNDADRLASALDEIIREPLNPQHHIDAVESKLFGIGAESYTVGSNEFCFGYACSRQTALTLDAGHFHPTEVISDKISAALLYVPRLLLHVSRPVRWDSDHVVLLDDETQAIAHEIARQNAFDRVHIGLDFFDASIKNYK